MRTICTIIITTLLCWGCLSSSVPTSKNKINYDSIPNHSCKNITYRNLILDTLYFDAHQSSMEGNFTIQKDSFYFADIIASSILIYDKNGNFITSKLQQGRGPNEILGLNQLAKGYKKNGFVIIDEQWFIYLLDSNLNVFSNFMLRFGSLENIKKKINQPDPNDIGIYEVEYAKNKLRVYNDEYLFFPIVTEHVNFNAYEGKNARNYYRESSNLAKLSLESGEIEKILCNYPPVYEQYRYASNFKYILFDIDQEKLIFSFEIDSLVYQMNLQDSTILSYGNAGINMNTRYPEYQTLEDTDEHAYECRQGYGYYRDFTWISETNILFRSYRKREAPTPDGLQVYQNKCLLADVEVPRDFEIIGYIAPWYYASVTPDYDNEKFIIYRFKLQ